MTKFRNLTILAVLFSISLYSQRARESKPVVFTRADTLRGTLSPERTCYDVKYYHLDVRVDPALQTVDGSNTISFEVVTAFDKMQIDLFDNLTISKITLDLENECRFTREFNAVFVLLPKSLPVNSKHQIKIQYSGKPMVAKNPPWEGGLTWTHDSSGNPWVAVTCQGLGASVWWPNKDHQSDEPDSMLISISVPKGLEDVSNGRLRAVTNLSDGWRRYDWFVNAPINNYNVTLNIGKFARFSDTYVSDDTLTLDYYVLPESLEKAKLQFKQVKGMMRAFEKYFGKYPFKRDGYKLIECPHTGMEHQSAVAYGNRYLQGYRGRAPAEVGLKFDFIIIHESAHEWWGNNITSKDVADMWIHESFGAYAEALYVEYHYGFKEALEYINGKKPNVRNLEPIIGVYNVQKAGAGDMYDKGQLVLNTLRSVINDDELWFSILKGLQESFRYRTVTADDIVEYVNRRTGKDLRYFFDQYLKFPKIPELIVMTAKRGSDVTATYRWNTDVQDFKMPVRVTTSENKYEFIYPTTAFQTMKLGNIKPEKFRVEEDRFYVNLKLGWSYLDPALPPQEFRRR
jgi:aminopeptidase N